MATSIYKIFEDNQYSLPDAAKRSKTWFDQQVLLLRRKRYTPQKVLKDDPSALTKRLFIGRMYTFMYNPKTKDKLPYYDMFPLIFPFKVESNGFYGINFHYLPYYMRVRLLDRMMTLSTNRKMDETTRLKLRWSILEASTRYAAVKPSVKHYLNNNVRSLYKQIPAKDWVTAMLLPVEQFRGADKTTVWSDSRKLGKF